MSLGPQFSLAERKLCSCAWRAASQRAVPWVFIVLVINALFIAAIIWANKKDTTTGQRYWSAFLASVLALVSALFLVRGLDLKIVSEHEPLSMHEPIVSLLHLPSAGLFLVAVLFSVLVAELLRRVFQRVNKKIHLRIEAPEGNHPVGYVFGVCGVVYAVVLAFVVVTAWQRYDHAGEVVQEEQNAASDMFTILDRRGYEGASNARLYLRRYAYSMWAEWYIADRGKSLNQARDSGLYTRSCKVRGGAWAADGKAAEEDNEVDLDRGELWAHCLAKDLGAWKLRGPKDQADYAAAIAALERFTDNRAQRLRLSGEQLPALMWASLIFGAVVLLAFTFLFSGSPSNRAVHAAVLSSMMGILFTETLVFDHPFTGSLRISYDNWRNVACQFLQLDQYQSQPAIMTKNGLGLVSSKFICPLWTPAGPPADTETIEVSTLTAAAMSRKTGDLHG